MRWQPIDLRTSRRQQLNEAGVFVGGTADVRRRSEIEGTPLAFDTFLRERQIGRMQEQPRQRTVFVEPRFSHTYTGRPESRNRNP